MDAGTWDGGSPLESGRGRAEISVEPERPVAHASFPSILIFAGCAYCTAYFLFKFVVGEKGWDIKKAKTVRRRKPVTLALALMVQGWVAFAGLTYLTPRWYNAALWVGAGVTMLLLFGIWRVSVFDDHRKARSSLR